MALTTVGAWWQPRTGRRRNGDAPYGGGLMAGAMQGWFENVDPETRALLLQFLLEAAGSTERAKDAA